MPSYSSIMATEIEIPPLPQFRNSSHSEAREQESARTQRSSPARLSLRQVRSENAVTDRLVLRRFLRGDEKPFRELNEAWISRDFELEPGDREVLGDPQGKILAKGGQICLAELDGEVVGCCALILITPGEFELAKMTVADAASGKGIGRRLLVFAIAVARVLRAHRLYLESNTKAAAAIHLYEELGFRHMPATGHTSKYARANVFMEMFFPEPL